VPAKRKVQGHADQDRRWAPFVSNKRGGGLGRDTIKSKKKECPRREGRLLPFQKKNRRIKEGADGEATGESAEKMRSS